MFDRMARNIGPYGGTKESESRRPILQAIDAIWIVFIMLLIMLALLIMVGDYLGPVLLFVVTLIERWPRMPGQEMDKAKKIILNGLYCTGIALTLLVVYIGGSPVTYYRAAAGDLVMEHPWGSATIPIWFETLRFMFVMTGTAAEFILILLLSRVLTEMLFPSLANSVVATKGKLKDGIIPFMKIENFDAIADDEFEDEGIVPEGDAAPRRSYL